MTFAAFVFVGRHNKSFFAVIKIEAGKTKNTDSRHETTKNQLKLKIFESPAIVSR